MDRTTTFALATAATSDKSGLTNSGVIAVSATATATTMEISAVLTADRDGTSMELAEADPIPMILTCPCCGERHIDEGEFATKPHHTHACQHCGIVWRPALASTVGVQFLPGFKNQRG
jgi:predicted RNA-binding Zn-ribbon protein involved in translation (DUF1610 family)